MKLRILFLACFFGTSIAIAQTAIPPMVNSIPICTESQACVITAISDPNAVFQFGAGPTWCQMFNTPKQLPLAVTYTPPNSALCKYDPAVGVTKILAAQQRNTTFFVTYTLAGKVQPVMTIPGLLTATATPVSTFPAICTNYSDATFICAATGPVTPVVKQ